MEDKNNGLDTDTVATVKVSEVVRERLRKNNVRFFANDNISEHISEFELQEIQNELTYKFQDVLETLIIDTDNDPNILAPAIIIIIYHHLHTSLFSLLDILDSPTKIIYLMFS